MPLMADEDKYDLEDEIGTVSFFKVLEGFATTGYAPKPDVDNVVNRIDMDGLRKLSDIAHEISQLFAFFVEEELTQEDHDAGEGFLRMLHSVKHPPAKQVALGCATKRG